MTPKRAFFFWSGPKLTNLRWLSIRSFVRWHPDWRVILYSDTITPRIKDGLEIKRPAIPLAMPPEFWNELAPNQKADLFRWFELAVYGGLYCDTDVIWMRPITKWIEWRDSEGFDLHLTEDFGYLAQKEGEPDKRVSANVIASWPGNQGLIEVYNRILEGLESDGPVIGGSVALADCWSVVMDYCWTSNLPSDWIYPFRFIKERASRVWAKDAKMACPETRWALHWYGLSGQPIPEYGRKHSDWPACPVTEALNMAYRPLCK